MREWVRLYTTSWCHRKTLGLGLEEFGVWAMALAYAGSQEREDFVPAEWLESVTRDSVTPSEAVATRLVARGLWEPIDGGWLIHNHRNRQADEASRREQNRIRQQRWRERKAVTVTPVTRDAALVTDRVEKNENEKRVDISPYGESSSRVATDAFTSAWNGACLPLPKLRKAPAGVNAERLIHRAMEFFDNDLVLLEAAIRRAAADQHYRDGHYGYETFCRHVERWSEDVPRVATENAIDRRIREADERDRGWRPKATVIDMPKAVADGG